MSDEQAATNCNEMQRLDDRQRRAVDLLAAGVTASEVAAQLGVDRVTVWRWRREPAFIAELNARRVELWEASRDRFRALLPQAADVFGQALADGDVRAALALVKLAGLGEFGWVGPTDVEAIAAEERRLVTAQERRRQLEVQDEAEAEVRQLERNRDLELRRLLAG